MVHSRWWSVIHFLRIFNTDTYLWRWFGGKVWGEKFCNKNFLKTFLKQRIKWIFKKIILDFSADHKIKKVILQERCKVSSYTTPKYKVHSFKLSINNFTCFSLHSACGCVRQLWTFVWLNISIIENSSVICNSKVVPKRSLERELLKK